MKITKQKVQAVSDLKAGYTLCHADVAILNELARIALASIEAEPLVSLGMLSVKKARKLNLAREMAEVDDCDGCTHYRADICHGGKCAAPPAPVSVPEEVAAEDCPAFVKYDVTDALEDDIDSDDHPLLWSYKNGWNACRAAMLQGAEPVQGWIPCSERMPEKWLPVMVMYEDGEMWSAIWTGTRWDDGTDVPDPHTVTHWKEMPAAPQQEVE